MIKDPFIKTSLYALAIYASGLTSIIMDAPMTLSLIILFLGVVLTVVIWYTKSMYNINKNEAHQNDDKEDTVH